MSQLEDLAQHRDAILLAEIAAWLHMLGKFHEGFLKGNHDLDVEIPSDIRSHYPGLNSLLDNTWPGVIWDSMGVPEFKATSLSLSSFIKEHRNSQVSEGLMRLMWDAHGRGSGIEKGVLNRFTPGQTTRVYLSTAFGSESEPISLNEIKKEREDLYHFLGKQLTWLRRDVTTVDWNDFRRPFIKKLKLFFRKTVAESRIPLNDVTLFDQTFASVAFLKAALAQNLIVGWKDPIQTEVAQKYRWRLLKVGLNGPMYWGQAIRISDLLARRAVITSVLDQVQTLLEEEYPLANEIYRDENGSIFLMPDIADLLKLMTDNQTLAEHLQQIVQQALSGEAMLDLIPSDETRNILVFGRYASQIPPIPFPQPHQVQNWWASTTNQAVCTVCSLRPQGPSKKAIERSVCDTCEQRRDDYARKWIETNLGRTIWIDELSDHNGRLSLLVGQFGIDNWLNGTVFNSVAVFDPQNRLLSDPGRRNKQYSFDYTELLAEIAEALSSRKSKQSFGKWVPLLDNLLLNDARGGFNRFSEIYDLYVTDTDLESSTPENYRFALALLRQNPSFARLRRVWETTRQFWQDVCPTDDEQDIGQSLVGQTIKARPARLKITGTLTPQGTEKTLGRYHAYDLKLTGSVKLSVVWDPVNKYFITCDNLEYLAKPELLGCPVSDLLPEGKTISIEEPTGYGSQNKIWGEITIQEVETLPASIYTPAIPILAEPRTFMALVPADKALEIAQAIKTKYEREMGKVRNRLPLHLGVVYAHRRTPLRTILDAGQRMLQQKSLGGDKTWRVQADAVTGALPECKEALAMNTQQFQKTIAVHLEQDGHSFTWYVPAVMGDGHTDDNWYPYVFFQADEAGNTDPTQAAEKRSQVFRGVRPTANGQTEACWLVHAGDLKAGDQVYFTPATLDFEWLDTAARRFAIAYDEQSGWRRGRLTRPYLLDDLSTLTAAWECIGGQEGLTSSQIYALRDLVEAKREAWFEQPAQSLTSEPFRQLCCDAVVNAEWKKPPSNEQNEKVVSWLVSGLFADMVELFMSIMKAKPQRNEETL